MKSDFKQRVTKKDIELPTDSLVEDFCAEESCQASIWVDKDLKEKGRISRCMPCIVRNKFFKESSK